MKLSVFVSLLLFNISALAQSQRQSIEHFNKAISAFNDKDYKLAISEYSSSIDLKPDFAKAYYNRANAHLNLKEYKLSIRDFKKALTLDKTFIKAHLYLGFAYTQLAELDKALISYTKAIKADPEMPSAHRYRALAFMKKKKYEQAIEDFSKALLLKPNQTKVHLNRANCLMQLKRYDEAIVDYNFVLNEEVESNTHIYALRAKCHLKQKNFEQAIKDYNYALKYDEENHELWYLRGMSYLMLEENVAAHKDFKEALEKKPLHKASLSNKARLSLQLGINSEAIGDYTKLLAIEDDNTNYLTNRGIAKLKMKDYKGAGIDFTAAIKIDPKFALAYFNRANVQNLQDNRDFACTDMRQAARLGYKLAFDYIPSLCDDLTGK